MSADEASDLPAFLQPLTLECVFCDYRKSATRGEAERLIREHIVACTHHPLAEAKRQLAAAEARVKVLVEAVGRNHQWHLDYDDDGYPGSELFELNNTALNPPKEPSNGE